MDGWTDESYVDKWMVPQPLLLHPIIKSPIAYPQIPHTRALKRVVKPLHDSPSPKRLQIERDIVHDIVVTNNLFS